MKQTDLPSPVQPPPLVSPSLLAGELYSPGVATVESGDSKSSGLTSDGRSSWDGQNGVVPGRRVLIVDDEAAILFGFKKILQRGGVEVDTAQTVEEALNLLQAKDYQFVITDLKLSGSSADNGFDIIRFAKGKRPEAKIILITGYGTPEIMEKALSLGAVYYYEKPVSGAVLRDALIRVGM